MPEIDLQLLCKRWLHSSEEDTPAEMVFRPDSYNFPPARGRTGFELRSDHSLAEIRIGPTDRIEQIPGRWEIQGGDRLVFYEDVSTKPTATMQMVSADENRLVIKR